MSIERERLLSLIEFTQQSARLRGKPASSVASHKLFSLFEHELIGLPGLQINIGGGDAEDETWLSVQRLAERRPPDVTSPYLRPWIQLTQGTVEEPRLRATSDGASLIAAGTHVSSHSPSSGNLQFVAPEATVVFSDYGNAAAVHNALEAYLVTKWASMGRGGAPSSHNHSPLRPTIHA